MKHVLLIISLLVYIGPFSLLSQDLKRIWASEPILKVPESVLYSKIHNCLFVSNVFGKPTDKDDEGSISILSVSGEIKEIDWLNGFNAPKGMAIDSSFLYVADIDELVIVDVELKQINNRIKKEGAKFLNDVSINNKGDVFVSDMMTNQILKLKDGVLEVWAEGEDYNRVNGLYCEGDDLIVGTAERILKVSMVDKSVMVLIPETVPVDGLMADGNGGYYFSSWQGKLFHVIPGQVPNLLLNTSEDKINCADIGYDKESRLIFVPTFFDNRVVAYRWGN